MIQNSYKDLSDKLSQTPFSLSSVLTVQCLPPRSSLVLSSDGDDR